MPTSADRLSQLRAMSGEFTGISFVQVVDVCDQRVLRVYFHTDPQDLTVPFEGTGAQPITRDDIRIYSPRGEAPDVRIDPDPYTRHGPLSSDNRLGSNLYIVYCGLRWPNGE